MPYETGKLRIGAINWDSALPEWSYFGRFTLRNLATEKYKGRLPYFADKINGEYKFPARTQKDYNRELEYAVKCGIDFFAYCWYPDSAPENRAIRKEYEKNGYMAEYFPELNTCRKLYLSSEIKEKINMCAILFSTSAYSKSDFDELFSLMKQDFYEKIDGRPLVFTFIGYDGEFISLLRDMAGENGLDPYIVFLSVGRKKDPDTDYSGADAVSAYGSSHEAQSFRELTDITDDDNNFRLSFNLPVIPVLSMGWNPSPRIDFPVPWITYPSVSYPGSPDRDDIEYSFKKLDEFIKKNPDRANTCLALVFAWNEFEEGGYICPTLGENGEVNDLLLNEFAQVRRKY